MRRIILLIGILVVFLPLQAMATERTFSAGSWVIPVDSCWQPNHDLSNTINIFCPPGANNCVDQPEPGCDHDPNDKSIFQAFGLIYAILDRGDDPDHCRNTDGSTPFQKKILGYCKPIRIYWIIDKNKTDPHAPDLTITGTSTPLAQVFHSNDLTDTGSVNPLVYRGGPFVIDVNDITDWEMEQFMLAYPEAKIHKINIEFSGNVDKILIGKPPRVAVLNEGAITVLRDYLRASGLFSWENYVFVQLSARDVIAGCLEDPIPATCKARRSDITFPFQLMWAPHWIVEQGWTDGNPTLQEQNEVIQKIREFLERGNAGFFECASIESLEGSQQDGTPRAGNDYDQPNDTSNPNVGGPLIGANNNPPRIDANGGCSDTKGCGTDYLVFENVPYWLVQCGGWKYEATGGHVHNMRPNESAGYYYLTTKTTDDPTTDQDDRFLGSQLTRFIHDDPAKVNYNPSSDYYVYDYLVGGRINGSPTQGYVVYFPGHKYIQCQNQQGGTTVPPEKRLKLVFDAPLNAGTTVSVEVIHPGITGDPDHPPCAQGSTCPKADFEVDTGFGTSSVDNTVYVDADAAEYDPSLYIIEDIIVGNKTDSDLNLTDIIFYFPGNDSIPVRLVEVYDITDPLNPVLLCSPNATDTGSGVSCFNNYSVGNNIVITFDQDISLDPTVREVTVEAVHSSCTQGLSCPRATYNLDSGIQTASIPDTSGELELSIPSNSYDPVNKTLSVTLSKVDPCLSVTLTDFVITYPDIGGTVNVTSVYNTTFNEDLNCSGGPSVLYCSGAGPGSCNNQIANGTFETGDLSGWTVTGTVSVDAKAAHQANYGALFGGAKDRDGSISQSVTLSSTCQGWRLTFFYKVGRKGDKKDKFKLFINGNKEFEVNGKNETTWKQKEICLDDFAGQTITIEFSNRNEKDVAEFYLDDVELSADGVPCKGGGGGVSQWQYNVPPTGGCNTTFTLGPFTSICDIDWNKSNSCGIRYVLNTLLALKFELTSSEFVKTQPVVKDFVIERDANGNPIKLLNTLYKASFDYPIYRGHLIKYKRLITDSDCFDNNPNTACDLTDFTEVWDAAKQMPVAGVGNFPTAPSSNLSVRYIFTNKPGTTTTILFDPDHASTLMSYLGVGSTDEAKVLINTVRGRKGASLSDVYGSTNDCNNVTPDGQIDLFGCGEDSKRLWAIEESTPALMTDSELVDPADEGSTSKDGHRDIVIFAGAADGMLHAFHAGSWDSLNGYYTDGTGKEIWAYIPGSLLKSLQDQPFHPDPQDYSTFEPAVSVNGSPALGDLLVNVGTETNPQYEWRTFLIGTAEIRDAANGFVPTGGGILFALDVSNPYQPQVLWEGSYADESASGCEGQNKNCNMGSVRGVALGSVFTGEELKPVIFLTSNWINKKKPSQPSFDCSSNPDEPGCVYGVSVFAIDVFTGNVLWAKELPYSGDAVNVNVAPAIPSLMDIDNNGTMDYVVFGDMQGRLWVLSTLNGDSIVGQETVSIVGNNVTMEKPVFRVVEVQNVDNQGSFQLTTTETGAKEPIAAGVAVKDNYVVFGTGGDDYASNDRKYHLFVLRITSSGDAEVKYVYEGDTGEKIWAPPLITKDYKVIIGTAKDYYRLRRDVSTLNSKGRIAVINLKTGASKTLQIGGKEWLEGGIVGGFDVESGHAYTLPLRPASGKSNTPVDLNPEAEFTPPVANENPFKFLWWRKL